MLKGLGKKTLSLATLLLALSVSSFSSQATIVSTDVTTGMEIRYEQGVDASATDSGTTSSSVAVTGQATGATASSSIGFSTLMDEAATVDFSMAYDGNGYAGSGYMGEVDGSENIVVIEYFAATDVTMLIDWDFAYTGPDPFGLQFINVFGLNLGSVGFAGSHQGMQSFDLAGGSSYFINVEFSPNVSGGIGNINGQLAGSLWLYIQCRLTCQSLVICC